METLVSLLPSYRTPTNLLYGNGLSCHGARIESKRIEYILREIKRQVWVEGLYVRKKDLHKIIRYKNSDTSYRHDFDKKQFVEWITTIENNTAFCEMENKNVGNGIFVPPGKMLPQGTFIPSSGITKLESTIEEFETKFNCSALQDLNSPEKKIVGFITNFVFKESFSKLLMILMVESMVRSFYGPMRVLVNIEDKNDRSY